MNLYRAGIIAVLSFGANSLADVPFRSLDPAMSELPETLQFDCTAQPGEEKRTVTALGRKLIIPQHFSQSDTNKNWFDWNVGFGDSENPAVVPFATLSFGEHSSEVSFFEEWELVSTPTSNHLGAEIRYKEPDRSLEFDRFELILFQNGLFLKSMSAVPIDWVSLINCFE